MNSLDNQVTACRLCQHYKPEGRRGGMCNRLDVPVLANWESCSLAAHPFELSWQASNNINSLLQDSLQNINEEELVQV
ncbi:MAG: hypothetical protein NW214_01585 [Pseudanabaenaceae cyanobacterium bins.39]|nr:hypothetical protein [Pseudanabaenaceae cyanobacterium bins.39]